MGQHLLNHTGTGRATCRLFETQQPKSYQYRRADIQVKHSSCRGLQVLSGTKKCATNVPNLPAAFGKTRTMSRSATSVWKHSAPNCVCCFVLLHFSRFGGQAKTESLVLRTALRLPCLALDGQSRASKEYQQIEPGKRVRIIAMARLSFMSIIILGHTFSSLFQSSTIRRATSVRCCRIAAQRNPEICIYK